MEGGNCYITELGERSFDVSVAVEGTDFSVWKGLGDKLEMNAKKEKVIRSSKEVVSDKKVEGQEIHNTKVQKVIMQGNKYFH